MTKISVVLCTHNPRPDFLRRVLDALRRQTLALHEWELLVVDNASTQNLAEQWDISWHPKARHVREDQVGLTAANLRGLREAAAEVIVFVHDDNVLEPDYLEKALEILQRMPFLGAFNGSTIGEFEGTLPSGAHMMPEQLAVREIKKPAWGCVPGTRAIYFAPVGAGMVIRREVLQHYSEKLETEPLRKALGRQGSSLSSGEDTDMAYCACELGYAVGVFPDLSLLHLMPEARLQRDYLLRLAEGMAFSHAILRYLWDKRLPQVPEPGPLSRSARLYESYKRWRGSFGKRREPTFEEEQRLVSVAGLKRAKNFIEEFEREQQTKTGG